VGGTSHSFRRPVGVPGLNDIPLCGPPGNQDYLLRGSLGTKEITLATHFILKGKRKDESCLSVLLSESNSLT
jgi:KaiC/GvpD/RAD55 family RecA-like ATPase